MKWICLIVSLSSPKLGIRINTINSSTDGWRAKGAICISSEKFLMCHGQYMVYEVCSSYRKVGFLFIKETKITPCLWGGWPFPFHGKLNIDKTCFDHSTHTERIKKNNQGEAMSQTETCPAARCLESTCMKHKPMLTCGFPPRKNHSALGFYDIPRTAGGHFRLCLWWGLSN